MTRACHVDFETRSPVDLKKTGAYVYFDHPHTDVWCMAYAFDDQPVDLWVPGEPCPYDLAEHIRAGGKMVAHNAAFERVLFEKIMGPRYGWPVPKLTQWHCTMAMALALALPGALEDVGAIVGATVLKDDVGARTMKMMSKPRRPRKGETVPPGGYLWWDDADRLKILYAYCMNDVDAERAIEKKLLPLSGYEQVIWWLDQKINDRGVCVDTGLCHAALAIVEQSRERLDREMRDLTMGEVASTSAVNQLKAWLRDMCGFDVGDSLAKDALAEFLVRSDLDPNVRRALELRQEGSRTSVSKIDALLNGLQSDLRSRGLLQYHAASTGRWGGRRFQPQNIKRPTVKDVDTAIDIVRRGDVELVEMMFGDPLSVIGDTLRGMVVAAEGHELVVADYSNVEGRVLAWLAGEQWKLDAFDAYDRGEGPDLYKLAYGRAFGIPAETVDKDQRQVGKVMELALGYQGGVGAFETMAAGYGVKIGTQHNHLFASAPSDAIGKVERAWKERGKASGIGQATWEAAELVKVLWRNAHPATVSFWRDMEDAALTAVREPGEAIAVGKVSFVKRGSFLFMVLPSGRRLAYAFPKIEMVETGWTDKDGAPVLKPQLKFKGVDSVTRQWITQSTYGGKLVENASQAMARDLMVAGMIRVEKAGYAVVLSVHDELVSEVPEGFGSVHEFEALMSAKDPWAEGLPLVAEGWQGKRYKKG